MRRGVLVKCGGVHNFLDMRTTLLYKDIMDTRKAGRLGALKTNSILTTEVRRRAAKKGWRNRKKKLEQLLAPPTKYA